MLIRPREVIKSSQSQSFEESVSPFLLSLDLIQHIKEFL